MIRTKYLLITIVACIGIIFSTGFASMPHSEPTFPIATQEAHFAVPNDVYTVTPFRTTHDQDMRDDFILKIRDEIARDRDSDTEEGVVDVLELEIESDQSIASSTIVE